jgi:pimeloyl-ACP methyl ester carboxylesterase
MIHAPIGISRPARKTTTALLLLLATTLLSGCIFKTVREQQAIIDTACHISGTVTTVVPGKAPLVVGLMRHGGGNPANPDNWNLVDHFVLEAPGRFLMRARPGTYGLFAFEDRNADLKYQPAEPFLRIDPNQLVNCTQGEDHRDIALAIPKTGAPRVDGIVDITALQARTVQDQLTASLGTVTAVGKVTTLDDPRFSEENAKNGLWAPFDFLFTAGPGVYFLEPYRANKIPVLFVHGINGTPINFRYVIEHLDRSKFQPWVYFYPSGASLANVAEHLNQTMRKLQRMHHFDQFYVVAHSMGGLVSRGFILNYHDSPHAAEIPLYITIATPWGGHKSAESGVKHAPAVVRVWYDMVPDSAYNRGIFYKDPDTRRQRRALPPSMTHHLLFTFNRNSSSFGESDDHSVTVASQMYAPAQDEARRLYGFDLTHTGVLENEQVSKLVNRLLATGGR